MKQLVIGLAVTIVVVLGAYLLVKPTQAPQTAPAEEAAEVAQEASTEEITDTVSQATEEAGPETGQGTEESEGTAESGEEASAGVALEASNETSEEVETLVVTMSNLKFTPSTLTIKADVPYKLTLISEDAHTYTIDKLGINFVLDAADTKTFDLKVTRKGTYNVYCSEPGHKNKGMVGKLIVQ